jgi:hypothetical protein
MKINILHCGITIVAAAFQFCTPVFSELQRARTAGKGHVEFGGSYSKIYVPSGLGPWTEEHVGLQSNIGLGKKADLRVRYESILSSKITVVALGPKFSLSQDKCAFSLLLVKLIGPEGGPPHIQPSFLFTIPVVKNKVEITMAPKALIFANNGLFVALAGNANLAISSDLKKWAIIPELGVMTGRAIHASIGLTINFGK